VQACDRCPTHLVWVHYAEKVETLRKEPGLTAVVVLRATRSRSEDTCESGTLLLA
jgi:hypothetical protein